MARGKVELKGVIGIRVGRDSVVGAGAVVTKDVKEFTVVAGNPARKIGMVPKEHRLEKA
jgi:acetyltransferase-like isoleucine patch superfamily enzyme